MGPGPLRGRRPASWADLSEGDYGVGLLNDCKYGHDIKGDIMRLTLLKSAIKPDPNADRGDHQFTYALYPHPGDWYDGGTTAQGYRLNNPLAAVRTHGGGAAPGGGRPGRFAFVDCTAPNVLVETVQGRRIRRRRGRARLRVRQPQRPGGAPLLPSARRRDRSQPAGGSARPVRAEGDTLHFDVRPFEIKTFLVQLAPPG